MDGEGGMGKEGEEGRGRRKRGEDGWGRRDGERGRGGPGKEGEEGWGRGDGEGGRGGGGTGKEGEEGGGMGEIYQWKEAGKGVRKEGLMERGGNRKEEREDVWFNMLGLHVYTNSSSAYTSSTHRSPITVSN